MGGGGGGGHDGSDRVLSREFTVLLPPPHPKFKDVTERNETVGSSYPGEIYPHQMNVERVC